MLRAPHPPHALFEIGKLRPREVFARVNSTNLEQIVAHTQLSDPPSAMGGGPLGLASPDAHPVLHHTQPGQGRETSGLSLCPAVLMSWSLDLRSCWWPKGRPGRCTYVVGDGQSPGLGRRVRLDLGRRAGLDLAVPQHPHAPRAGPLPGRDGSIVFGVLPACCGQRQIFCFLSGVHHGRPGGHLGAGPPGGASSSYQTAEPRFEPKSSCF